MTDAPSTENAPRRWLLGWPGLAAAFAWGLAEGSFFFLIPDILLTLTALFSVKRSLQQMVLVVAGSLVAGCALYQWSQADSAGAKHAVLRVPFVRERMFTETEQEFKSVGLWALFKGPSRGIPYKVYAVQAPAYTPLSTFLLASVPARFERLVLSWIVFTAVGYFVRKRGVRPLFALLFHAVYWSAIYAYYWTVI